MKSWELLGYYARARNLHKAARIVVNELGGKIPEDYDNIKKLSLEHSLNKNLGKEITGVSEEIILNTAILVDNQTKKVVTNYLNKENERLKEDYIYVKYTGPWPPYHFIPSFEE